MSALVNPDSCVMSRRSRQRPYDPSAHAHDRRGFYSGTDRVRFGEIPDPYVHASEREPVESRQGGEWVVPAVPTLIVARSRSDLLGGLHVRHQIGDAEFQAGRLYQRLAETAGRSIKSGSLEPRVQGGLIADVPNVVLIAARKVRLIDGKIVLAFGTIGIMVLRGALVDGIGAKRMAARFGDRSERGIDWFGRLLRETLTELAIITGFTTISRQVPLPIRAWAAAVTEAVGEIAGA
jgi:hypothetical protein